MHFHKLCWTSVVSVHRLSEMEDINIDKGPAEIKIPYAGNCNSDLKPFFYLMYQVGEVPTYIGGYFLHFTGE